MTVLELESKILQRGFKNFFNVRTRCADRVGICNHKVMIFAYE